MITYQGGITTCHNHRSDDPVDNYAEPDLFPYSALSENVVEGLVSDLT
jgi:hypothetical protein